MLAPLRNDKGLLSDVYHANVTIAKKINNNLKKVHEEL